VGGGIPLSLGTAYSEKYKRTDRVTACFFSEGASNHGTFNEAMNIASLWKLPLIFVCENNLFAATTPSYETLSHPDVAKRAEGYAMQGVIADGNDVSDVYEKTMAAVEKARTGNGPTLIECKTYRVEGHCMVLKDLPQHRPKIEVEGWAKKDPIDNYIKRLQAENILNPDLKISLEREIEEEFEKAIEFAKNSPFPDVNEFRIKVRERYGV
jgi:TPP-dependent pyruvate/acetoin dehydrogenase alpha subunit